MSELSCLIHGPECTDIYHILFVFFCFVLGLLFLVLLSLFFGSQIEAIIRDRERVKIMYEVFYDDRRELHKLRKDLDLLIEEDLS